MLDTSFVDPAGRISEKPKSYANGITDNPLLFTGEYLFLKKKLGQLDNQDRDMVSRILTECEVAPGLYRRHPPEYQLEYGIPYNQVSHDEYVGIMLLCHVNNLKYVMSEVCEYGEKNYWQFNCAAPYSNFWDLFKSRPTYAIKEFYIYKKQYNANPDDTNSVDANYPVQEVVSLNFQRQPRDIAFYELMANGKTSYFNLMNLCAATLLSTRRSLEDGKRGGTILLAMFRIELLNDSIKMPLLLRKTHDLFKRILVKKYGKNYASHIAKRYFDLKDNDGKLNPIIYLLEQLEAK